MLACARIGAVHSVVFGGFAASELAIRIDDAKPKVILSAELRASSPAAIVKYKPLLNEAMRLLNIRSRRTYTHPLRLGEGEKRHWFLAATSTGPRRATKRDLICARSRGTIACPVRPPTRFFYT